MSQITSFESGRSGEGNRVENELSYRSTISKKTRMYLSFSQLTAASCVLAAPDCAWAAGTSERPGIATSQAVLGTPNSLFSCFYRRIPGPLQRVVRRIFVECIAPLPRTGTRLDAN